jgi:quercetin dioxygenase-like cupin family protein
MYKIITILILLFSVSCSNKSENNLLPENVSPEIYKVLFENDRVKVLKATFEPGKSDKMHNHFPMTAYVASGGKVEVTLPDGTVNERNIPSGATIHNPKKDTHQVKNIGDSIVEVYLVERKVTHEPYKLDLVLPEIVSPDVYKVLLDNEEVKVLEVTFAPNAGDLMHEHGVITYFSLSGGEMKNTLADGKETTMKIPNEFAGHGDKVVKHQMQNLGDSIVKLILVEHKNLKLSE